MTSTQKQWLFILTGLLIIAAAWMYYNKMVANKAAARIAPLQASKEVSQEEGNDGFPLKIGSQGKRVEKLQIFLQSRKGARFPKFGIDGNFGQETLDNVVKHLGVSEISEPIFKTNRLSDYKTFTY